MSAPSPEVVEVALLDLPRCPTLALALGLEDRTGLSVTSVLTTTDPRLVAGPLATEPSSRSSRVVFGDRALSVVETPGLPRVVSVADALSHHPSVGDLRLPGVVPVGVVADALLHDGPTAGLATNAAVGELTRRVAALDATRRESVRVVLSARYGRWAIPALSLLVLGHLARPDLVAPDSEVPRVLSALDDLDSGSPVEWVARRFRAWSR